MRVSRRLTREGCDMKWHSLPALKLYSPFQINRLKALLGICHFPSYHEQRRLKKNGKQRISYKEISRFPQWSWQLVFVADEAPVVCFLASLKPFGFKLSLGICILSQGGLWVTVNATVAWPGCLAVLRGLFFHVTLTPNRYILHVIVIDCKRNMKE